MAALSDRLAIAAVGSLLGTLLSSLSLYLPGPGVTGFFGAGLSLARLIELVGLQTELLPGCLTVSFLLLLGLGGALSRFGPRRLALTRPLLGLTLATALVAGASRFLLGEGVPALLLPVGLAGMWAVGAFGLEAGLLVTTATVMLIWPSLPTGAAPLWLLGRAVGSLALFGRRKQRSFVAPLLLMSGGGLFLFPELLEPGLAERMALGPLALALLGVGFELVLARRLAGLGRRLLGQVSRERLHALLNLEGPLLRRMVERAPGSFEHSRAMANLAEHAASAIGADTLLIRVGAYYHDLGKSFEPECFIENMASSEASPHRALSPLQSAQKIHAHVRLGVEILRKHGIPEPVVEFAYTHHGTQYLEFFLHQAQAEAEATGVDFDSEAFRYPGMKPTSRETGLLMLVDSIEAAARTVDEPSEVKFQELVFRIVFSKLKSGQLDDAGLSVADLRLVSERVVSTLVHMNHQRIKYPWQERRESEDPAPKRRAPIRGRGAAPCGGEADTSEKVQRRA